jgi:hypothetical protein
MYNHRGSHADKWDSQDSYACTQYSKYPPKCTMHYIKTSEARQLVLEAIKTVSDFVRENEKEFVKIIREENELRHEVDSKSRQKQLDKIVKKYTDFSELTPEMLNEYIEKIVVYEAERVNHRRKQKVEIYLNFIGRFAFPNQAEPDEEPRDPVEEKRAKWREYYYKTRDKILAKKREATAQKRADKKATKSPEVISAEQQARKDQKREYHREYAKKWREENREKVREISKKYREKKRAEKSRQTA